MNHDLAQACSLPEGRFCIAIAPYTDLVPAVIRMVQEERRRILYVSGNYPPVLTAVDRRHGRFSVRRALTAYQYLTILTEAYESCIIIEHDRSVYTDAPETAEPFGRLCREKAEDAAVLLIARRWDASIAAMAPAAHSVVYIPERDTWPAAVHERRKKKEVSDPGRHGAQRHLGDGDWQ